MSPDQAILWRKAAISAARGFGQRILAAVLDLGQASAARWRRVRQRIFRTGAAIGDFSRQAASEAQANIGALSAVFSQQRHGTWLILFGLLFTLFWLLAGWIGMANGVGRGLLVGIVTPLSVSALYPLRRSAR